MTQPTAPAPLPQVPHGATARRLEWELLPPTLRRLIEQRLGSPVVETRSAGAGFTPGFASVLVGQDGRRIFVKAASTKAQRPFADAYREEVRKLRGLPPGLPVPRLLWSHEDDLWVVLGLEYVEGANPSRPWRPEQLEACLDTLEVLADALDPAPAALGLAPLSAPDEFGGMVSGWDHVARTMPAWPHREEATALARRHAELLVGEALVHTDARDDNFLVTTGGRALLCDWNWPARGPRWVDSVLLMISAAGDGLDAEELLGRRRLTRDADPEAVDALLALVCGFFLEARTQPVPNSSPWIRVHQDWYAQTAWAWLSRRRGWT
ncbi:MAG: phosphotransferase [Oryzihumus sp.]